LLHHAKAAAYDKASAARLAAKGSLGHEYTSVAKKIEADLEKDELYAAANEIYPKISKPFNRFQESVLSEIAKQKPDGGYIIKDAEKAPQKLMNVTPEEAKYIKSKLPQKTIDDAVAGYFDSLAQPKEASGRIQSVFAGAKKNDEVLQIYLGDKYEPYKKISDVMDMIAKGRGSMAGSPTELLKRKGQEVDDARLVKSLLRGDKGGVVEWVIKKVSGRSSIDEALITSKENDILYDFVMTPKGLQKIKELASKEKQYLNNRYVFKQLAKAANIGAAATAAKEAAKKRETPAEKGTVRDVLGFPKGAKTKQDYIPNKTLDLGTIYPKE